MSRPVRTEDAEAALRAILTEQLAGLNGEAEWSGSEAVASLGGVIERAERRMRYAGGPDVMVRTEALIERAVADALEVWERHNPQDVARDRVWLALDELRDIERDDALVGELTRAAHARAKATHGDDPVAAVQSFVNGFDFIERDFGSESLPGGERVDAREGQPGREGVPAPVLAAFDHYYWVEAEDWGSASLHRAVMGGQEVWAVYLSTDGDAGFFEALTAEGEAVAGARLWGGAVIGWDTFPRRLRLDPTFTAHGGYTFEEGMSEPDERAAFAQPPRDWTGEVVIDRGAIHSINAHVTRYDFEDLPLSAEQRELAVAAFDYVWSKHLRHVVWGDRPLELGSHRKGVMTIGAFTRSTTGQTFQTAWWRDVDDASFVLYYARTDAGLRLAIEQFDN